MLKASTVLHQAHCIAFIRRGLLRLQPEAINQVTAYAWQVGDTFPLWIAAFSLESIPTPHQLKSQLNGGIERSSENRLSVQCNHKPLTSKTSVALPESVSLPPNSSYVSKQRFELLKLGVVIVLTTAVYFMVTGV